MKTSKRNGTGGHLNFNVLLMGGKGYAGRGLSLLIVFALLCAVIPAGAEEYKSEALNNVYFPNSVVNLGYPMTNTKFIDCAFSVEDGRNILYTGANGMPASLVCYDLSDRSVIREIPLPNSESVWSIGTDSKGNVYAGGCASSSTISKGKIYKWDPVKKELTDYGAFAPPSGRITFLYGICFDDEDNLYAGSYPSPWLVKLNAKTGQYEYLTDQLAPGETTIRATGYSNGYIYGFGFSDNCHFARYDIATKEIKQLTAFVAKDGDPTNTCNGITAVGDYLLCYLETIGKKYIMVIYKISEDKWLDDDNMIINTNGNYAVEHDGKMYYHNANTGKLAVFDPETETVEQTAYSAGTIRSGKFFEFDTPSLPGITMVTVQSTGTITYNNFGSGTYENVETTANPLPVPVRRLERGLSGTGTIAISGYMGTKMGILNDMTNEINYVPNSQQIEGMGEAHGEFYTGGYVGANLSTIDFEKYTRNQFASLTSHRQDRPFGVIEAGDYTAFSSVADYGVLGGALTLVDPKTKETEVFANIIKNQSIIGMAYKDGKIYGSTAVWGGTNISPTEPSAKLFIFDIASKRVIKEAAPAFKSFSAPALHIGELSFAADGSLWGVSNGNVFEIDTDTLEIKREILIKEKEWKISSIRWSPFYIRWMTDTVMLTNAGDIVSLVDISTNEFKTLMPDSVTYMALSENNNLYYASPDCTVLYKRPLNLVNDRKHFMEAGLENAVPDGYERIEYKNFGFPDPSFMSEKEVKQGTADLVNLTFSGVANSNKYTGSMRYGKSGIYNDLNLDLYPQSVSLENKDGKNSIKIVQPAKGLSNILALPVVEFNNTYPKNGRYKFIADIFVPSMVEVDTPDNIDLDTIPAKVYGAPQHGAYVTFMDSAGNRVGDTARVYIDQLGGWQTISIDIEEIPTEAVSMVAYIYTSSSGATSGTYIANPAFYIHNENWIEQASIDESVILHLDKSVAYVNLFKFAIDKDNEEIMPFTRDSRTLVPVRFISEATGAKVDWEQETQTVSISKEDTVIKIKIGEKSIDINGATSSLDTAAIVENGRTYLPLRAVTEALGKTVFWDDRGLIVITKGDALDADEDKELIDNIISYFENTSV